MANITNTLVANVTSTEDSTGNVIINRSTGQPAFDSTSASINEYIITSATPLIIQTLLTWIYQLYIRNIDTANNINVAWTPQSTLIAAEIVQLGPGDQLISWCNPSGSGNNGIRSVTMSCASTTAKVEYFIGG
jgi:hypothetical protein